MKAAAAIGSVTPRAADRRHSVGLVLLSAVAALLIVLPLTVIDTPLLADYPNHVARIHIISNYNDNLSLAERYMIAFDGQPNIAMDLLVPQLARIMPFDLACRLFLAFGLVSSLASVAWLHRSLFGRWSFYPLLAVFFVHHGSWLAGLVNFSVGIGLVPAALAVWIGLGSRSGLQRWLVGTLLALGLYFCHLVAFGAYGLLVFGYELGRAWDRWRHLPPGRIVGDLAVAGGTAILPILLFLRLALAGDGQTADGGIVFGNVAWKLKALLAPLAHYHLPLDLATFAILAGLVLLFWRNGWLVIDGRLKPGLFLLGAAFLLAPKALWTGGVFDQRLMTLLLPMLIACSRVTLPHRGLRTAIATGLAMLFILRLGFLMTAWFDHRRDLAEMRAMTGMMAEGRRLLVVRPDEGAGLRLAPPRHRVFHHAAQLTSLPMLAVIEKDVFVSTIYAIPGQQPLTLNPPYDRLGGRGHDDLPTFDTLRFALTAEPQAAPHAAQIADWTGDFDYVLVLYGYGPRDEAATDGLPLDLMIDGEIMDLYRIDKASAFFQP